MKLTHWIIIGLCAVIALLLLFGGGDNEEHIQKVTALETDNKAKDAQILENNNTIAKLTTRIAQDAILYKDTITIIKKESVQLERNLAHQKAKPEVVRIIRENPVIDTLVQTYDSLLSKKDEQIYLQAKYVNQLQTDLAEVENNFREQIALHVKKFENEKKIADEYRRELRKKKRGAKLARVLVPVALVGGFLLGGYMSH